VVETVPGGMSGRGSVYETVLGTEDTYTKKAIFRNQHIYKKEYYKSGIKDIYNKKTFTELINLGVLPEDTSDIFFVLQKKRLYSFFFDSYENDASSYQLLFTVMKTYNLDTGVLSSILRIFDENIHDLQRIDDKNYHMLFKGESLTLMDTQLFYRLSSGTTKGLLLYIHMAVSLQQGFDLLMKRITLLNMPIAKDDKKEPPARLPHVRHAGEFTLAFSGGVLFHII